MIRRNCRGNSPFTVSIPAIRLFIFSVSLKTSSSLPEKEIRAHFSPKTGSTEGGGWSSEVTNYKKIKYFLLKIFSSLKLSPTATSVSIISEARSLFPLSQALTKHLPEI